MTVPAASFEMVIGPGETPFLAAALMAVAQAHGAHVVGVSADDYVMRIDFDQPLDQAEIVEALRVRLR